jgi:hypothetical protein
LGKELITMRVRTAGWWPHSGRARLDGSSARGGLRLAVLAVVMVAAGMTAGSAGAAGQRAVNLRLVYSCAFPSGPQQVGAQVTGTFPADATAGKPIQPTGTGITVTLSHDAVANLAWTKADTVTLTAALSTGFTEGSKPVTAAWRDLRSASAAIPQTGPLSLSATGAAAPVTVAAAGNVTATVGDLTLLLTAHTANGRQASPHSMQVSCVPGANQDTSLARIAVTGSAPTRVPASPQDNPAKCLPFPKNLKLNPRFPLPPPLPGSKVFHSPTNGCAYAAGFANERKLHEAALVGPGLADLKLGKTVYSKPPSKGKPYTYLQIREPGKLQYHGLPELPPARATLLGFGFMPVSATLQISEIGTLNADLISCGPAPKCPKPVPPAPPQKNIALFFMRVSLSISDVHVNGVPLNVGPHCQTSPFDLDLTGLPPAYNIGAQFGVLTGTVTVPQFHGCADGTENLDPIFTASVSGPGNFVKVTQAPFCTPVNGGGCPPAKPKPVH